MAIEEVTVLEYGIQSCGLVQSSVTRSCKQGMKFVFLYKKFGTFVD